MSFAQHSSKFEEIFQDVQSSVLSKVVTGKNIPSCITMLRGLIDKMELCTHSQPAGGYALKSKVQKYWIDLKALETEYKKLEMMNRAETQAQEREKLLGGVTYRRPEVQMDMEAEVAYQESMKRASFGLDGLIDSQREALTTLKSNRNSLKGIKDKALSAANTLGMGSTVIRLIEKRSEQDMLIFFAGCAVVVILLILMLVYFR